MMAVENFNKYDLSSLRCVQYGGGPMPSTVIREVLSKLPCQIIQGYGQTEGTTMTFLSQEDHIKAAIEGINEERLKSCGREGFVTSVQVVDKDGKAVMHAWRRAPMTEGWRAEEERGDKYQVTSRFGFGLDGDMLK